MAKPTVVIIGASFAGLQVARGLLGALSGDIKVVLINPSDLYYFNIAAPRIMTKPRAFKREQYLLPIRPAFEKYGSQSFQFIQGRAQSIDPHTRTVTTSVESAHTVTYDYLVIASGSSPTSFFNGTQVPFKSLGDDPTSAIRKSQETISAAKSAIIAGAGPIGIEFAGELAEAWAGKNGTSITLISASEGVLPSLKNSVGKKAELLLAKHNVKIIRSKRVIRAEEGSKGWKVTLNSGEELSADVYIASTGVVPNNDFIPPEFLSEKGWVKVDEHFRLQDQPKQPIYAIGDITNLPLRTAIKVAEQVPVVVGNLKADILGNGKRQKYVPNDKILMFVPVGASSGTGQMGGMRVWGKMVSMFKGKDFMVSKAAGMVGLS
ncbi:AMID-like mitochondrial oxidoreductase [Penicillium sp. IBT 18751x]|nr:AMID-like mitochondrial oxidoreductase [Penicillium sp. IBT 18751x]